MPFRSERQRKFLYAKHPKIAKKWTKKYGSKIRPKKKRGGEKKRSKRRKRKFSWD